MGPEGTYRWTQLADSPHGLWGHAAVGYGSDMFVHGGTNMTFAYFGRFPFLSSELQRYDSVNNVWKVRIFVPMLRPSSTQLLRCCVKGGVFAP